MTAPLDQWVWKTTARDGTPITIRPLRKDDEQREIAFIASLSERTRYFRMFTPLKYLSPQMLRQFMDVDYGRRMALVATVGEGDQERFVAVARYGPTDKPDQAELGITVTDAWQRRGIAAILIRALLHFAEAQGFREVIGVVLPENYAMIELARNLGFTISLDSSAHLIRISRPLPLSSEVPAAT
jgi:RimJ/RimL family protein N-acetyltransferase